MNGLFDYIDGTSQIHKLNPMTKLVLSFCLCVTCFVTQNHFVILLILAFNLSLAAAAGREIFKRSLRVVKSVVKLASVLFFVQVLFISDGVQLFKIPPGIVITDLGILFSLLFSMRLIIVAAPLALMLTVTRVNDICNVLVRDLRLPFKYAFVITTAIRFIPLFAAEMTGIVEAQIARGVEFDTKNFYKKVRLLLPLCVPLLISSVRKIEGGAISAELRGFNLRNRFSGWKRYGFAARDAYMYFACAAIITLSILT